MAIAMENRQSRRGLLLTAFLGITAVAMGVVAWKHLRAPAAPVELPQISRSEFDLRDGRLRRKSDGILFTGFLVEYYASNQLQSRSLVSNGLLNGVSEGWRTNGQLQVREYFKDGVSNGPRVKWHAGGGKMSEGNIINGKHEGLFRRWHENGALAEEIEMRNGQPDGQTRTYYPSGCLQSIATLRAGSVVESKTWKDGEQPGASRP